MRIFRKVIQGAIGRERGAVPRVTVLTHKLECGHVIVERTYQPSTAHHRVYRSSTR